MFSAAPFVGVLVAWLALGDTVRPAEAAAVVVAAFGVSRVLGSDHHHDHAHDAVEHDHEHVHDDAHHNHQHPDPVPAGPHAHRHRHEAVVHAHPHLPDVHHRHVHTH